MKVACIQMDVLHCRKQENLEKALHMAHKAVKKEAEIIVFPEVFSTGFCYENLDYSAENFPSPILENLACFSEANDCVLLGSVIEKIASDKNVSAARASTVSKNSTLYYNLGFCFEAGTLAGTYRKTHPFKNENEYFSRGDSLEPIFLRKQNLKIGFEICYELRFPEVARKLTLSGSDLLVTSAAFPNPRSKHWNILARARAIENQLPHIACNRIGSAPDCTYFGNSMIIDAWGEIKADAGDKECAIVCDIDLDKKDEIRKTIPVFEDRRTELY
ncbi:MAG TPA: nitrilase-related carbon-nitrogen hydrolase [Methanosarcina sp.]|nr:nitrilase-related carbon-nitrogen hydrolase [Methanosarcina sp.]